LGTNDAAPPEQFEAGRLDARTDVYATGCMLYHSLTGRVPFPADSAAAGMFAHMSQAPPPLDGIDPSIVGALDAVIAKAMAKAPDDRYLSAGDLGRAAMAAIEGKAVTRAEHSVAIGKAAEGDVLEAGGAVPLTRGPSVFEPVPTPLTIDAPAPPARAVAPTESAAVSEQPAAPSSAPAPRR